MSENNNKPNNKPKWTIKRITAIAVIVLLVGMYITTLVLAITAKPNANGMFLASLICSIFIPIMMYLMMWITDVFTKRKKAMFEETGLDDDSDETDESDTSDADTDQKDQ